MDTANTAYIQSLEYILNHGKEIIDRGMETKEILNDVFKIDMNYPVVSIKERKLNYSFMAAEAYWITSGGILTEEIAPYNKHIAEYSDDGYIFNGAYGPMFISQIEYVVNALKKDINTRQAVMAIWIPNPVHSKDYRCTVSLIFQVRDGKIHTTVQMRSNDLILGRPYDIFNFTVMTLRILTRLNSETGHMIELGTLTLNTASAHIYDTHYEWAERIVNNPGTCSSIYVPNALTTDWNLVTESLLTTRDKKPQDIWVIRP